MKQLLIAAAGLIVAFGLAAPVRAQVTLDVSNVTCDQFRGYKITKPDNIAIWLSGYHAGKRDSTTIDTQHLVENAKKLVTYCIRNPQTPIMQAFEAVFGEKK